MKLESYQANMVVVNQNTDPKRHGVCGNDGIITFQPEQLRDAFMAEWAALVAVAEAAESVIGLIGNVDHSVGNGPNSAKMRGDKLNDIRLILTTALAAVRAGSEVAK